ncbi:hypothetical protein NDU88_007067 [Pleurodeles waltl]|uniref:Uncharacterized protein n=1 Tax=Pleurodeles waltl TaxID=8319 RepID=A0AAV7N194_PLEWA|nr:hypothetical protein NDU88_007067 [Pleurodeles waltl]
MWGPRRQAIPALGRARCRRARSVAVPAAWSGPAVSSELKVQAGPVEVPNEWLAVAGGGDLGREAVTLDVPREVWPPEAGAAILVPGAGGGTLVRCRVAVRGSRSVPGSPSRGAPRGMEAPGPLVSGAVGPQWICLGWARACAVWRGWPREEPGCSKGPQLWPECKGARRPQFCRPGSQRLARGGHRRVGHAHKTRAAYGEVDEDWNRV